jgi:hypothetical protein
MRPTYACQTQRPLAPTASTALFVDAGYLRRYAAESHQVMPGSAISASPVSIDACQISRLLDSMIVDFGIGGLRSRDGRRPGAAHLRHHYGRSSAALAAAALPQCREGGGLRGQDGPRPTSAHEPEDVRRQARSPSRRRGGARGRAHVPRRSGAYDGRTARGRRAACGRRVGGSRSRRSRGAPVTSRSPLGRN